MPGNISKAFTCDGKVHRQKGRKNCSNNGMSVMSDRSVTYFLVLFAMTVSQDNVCMFAVQN